MDSAYSSKLVPACSKSSLSAFLSEEISKIECEFQLWLSSKITRELFCLYSRNMVRRFFFTLLTIAIDSGSIGSGDVLGAFWHLKRKYVRREGELRLAHYRHHHTCVAARVLQSSSHVAARMRQMKRDGLSGYALLQGEQWFAKSPCAPLALSAPDTFLHLISPDSEIDLIWMMRFEAFDDTHAIIKMMCLQLNCTRVRQLLLLLVRWFQQRDISFDSYCVLIVHHHSGGLLSAASSILHSLKTDSRFVSAYLLSKLQDVVCRRREEAECISLVTGIWGLDWFNCLLLYLHIQLLDFIVLFGGSQAASTLHALQWQQSFPSLSLQGLNRACAFTDHIIVAGSGWFKSILDLLYFSLPRPPEIPQFTCFSSPRCKFLTS